MSRQNSDMLMTLSNEINYASLQLDAELRKQESVSQAVTQSMVDDAIELLHLFGVPYVLSPSEAEAQCAKLEELNLSNGTITDDSDIWLFGGRYVLKNFFQQGKYVLSYRQSDIQKLFGLDRNKMISLALVCGSDYTDGISGAGPITAMEILSEFSSNTGVAALSQFKSWADSVTANNGCIPAEGNSKIRTKLKKFVTVLPDSFPNHVVVDAYINPNVDESKERFEWSRPDLDLLRDFALRKLSWSSDKVDDLVCPVLKRLSDTETQSKLSKFFNLSGLPSSINTCADFHSKRLKSAITKLTIPQSEPSLKPVEVATSFGQRTATSKSEAATSKDKTKPRKTARAARSTATKRPAQTRKTAIRPVSAESNAKTKLFKEEINLSEESDSG